MSRRTLALGVAAALAAVGAGGCGGTDVDGASATEGGPSAAPKASGLVWQGVPNIVTPAELPKDRILLGVLRNASGGPVDLRVDRVDVKDADGRSLGANVRFVGSFGHGLYGPGGPPAPLQASRYDQARLGERLTLPANADRPMTVAWRVPKGRRPAAKVVVSGYTLRLP